MTTPAAGGLVAGVDIGGTKVSAGVVDETGRVLATARRASPQAARDAVAAVAAVVAEVRQAYPHIGVVGVGAAVWIAADRSTVVFAPHLPWRHLDLRAALTTAVGLPVVVENDANAAAWAEHRFGAGRDAADMLMITVGTGLGGGLVLGGHLHRGSYGIAGEPGHMQVVPDGRPCSCGNQGCWEQYASGHALVYEWAKLSRQPMSDVVDGVTGPAITDSALAGDGLALEAFSRVGSWLGTGIASLVTLLDPSCVVLGGGVSDAGPLLLEPARRAFEQSLSGRKHRPLARIVLAELGADAGMIGAADLARNAAVSGEGQTARV